MALGIPGVDLGRNVCSVSCLDRAGHIVVRRRARRYRLLAFLSELLHSTVAKEACGGVYQVARFCQGLGHEVPLISPLYVRP